MSKSSERGHLSILQGEKAELITQMLFHEWGWQARRDQPDHGFDLNVEVPADGSEPMHRFLVQVKGSAEFKVRPDGSWRVPVAGKRLSEYRAHRLPVFIVAFDHGSGVFRWCDTNAPILVAPTRLGQRRKKGNRGVSGTVYVRLPPEQTLGHIVDEAFVAAVRQAWKIRDDRHHPPVKATTVRQQLLAQKDERLSVMVNVIDGAEVRVISARDNPVPLKVGMTLGQADAERFRNTVAFGVPSGMDVTDFSITGSPIFDDLPGSGKLWVQPETKPLRLLLGVRTEKDIDWCIDEEGQVSFGHAGSEWQQTSTTLPLQISVRFDLVQHRLMFSYVLKSDAWKGKDYLDLPYLKPLRRLFELLSSKGSICIGVRTDGVNRFIAEGSLNENKEHITQMDLWLQTVEALSEIVRWSGRSIPWEEWPLDKAHVDEILSISRVVRGEVVNLPAQTTTIPIDEGSAILGSAKGVMVVRCERVLQIMQGEQIVIPCIIKWPRYEATRDVAAQSWVLKTSEGSPPMMWLDRAPDQPLTEADFGVSDHKTDSS